MTAFKAARVPGPSETDNPLVLLEATTHKFKRAKYLVVEPTSATWTVVDARCTLEPTSGQLSALGRSAFSFSYQFQLSVSALSLGRPEKVQSGYGQSSGSAAAALK